MHASPNASGHHHVRARGGQRWGGVGFGGRGAEAAASACGLWVWVSVLAGVPRSEKVRKEEEKRLHKVGKEAEQRVMRIHAYGARSTSAPTLWGRRIPGRAWQSSNCTSCHSVLFNMGNRLPRKRSRYEIVVGARVAMYVLALQS